MNKAIIIAGAGIAVLGTAGYFFYNSQIDKVRSMTYDLVGLKSRELSLQKAVFDAKVKITSDSTLEAEVLKLDLKVLIDGKLFGVISDNKKPIIVPAKGYSIPELSITVNPLEIGSNAMDIAGGIFMRKDAVITFDGTALVKILFLKKEIPIYYSSTFKELTA